MKESVNYGPETAATRSRGRFRFAVVGFLLPWLVTSLVVHPLPHQAPDARAELFHGAPITPAVVDAFSHACLDCHSERTRWPWYSQVAPVSWLVESDVSRARKRFNVSRWDMLSATDQRLLLTAIATVIENREMPPARYVVLHPEAKLSAREIVEVITWTRAERRRLRESSSAPLSR